MTQDEQGGMQSEIVKQHRKSNRAKLDEARELLLSVSRDEFLGPTEFELLSQAHAAIGRVMQYPLNEAEKHEARTIAAIAEAVPERDEPAVCKCGKHYEGAPCEAEFCDVCSEPQGPLGYCVVEGDIHSRFDTEFVHTRFTESETSALYDRS